MSLRKISRKEFFALWAGAVGAAAFTEARAYADAGSARLRCQPLISGALRWYNPAFSRKEGLAGWTRELDDEQAIGFDLLWLSNVSGALADAEPDDPLRVVLDLCAERNVRVILDTGMTHRWYAQPDADKEKETVANQIRGIMRRYGGHPAFYAWYVPQEIYVAWDAFGAFIDEIYPAIVDMCKQAAPGKPVTVSPFFILDKTKVFGDFRFAEPAEYREYWTRLIRRSGFDVVMMQDSGEHFSYVANEQRRPFFEAMRAACDDAGAAFWGNVESAEFECSSIEEYVNLYGRVHHSIVKDAPWRPVPIDRLESKLRLAAEFAERIVTWGYCEFGRPHLNPRAAAWYETYRQYVRRVKESDEATPPRPATGDARDGTGTYQAPPNLHVIRLSVRDGRRSSRPRGMQQAGLK